MGGVPDGWFDYSGVGTSVSGTRFIPFKVPLKEGLCLRCNVPEKERFTPKALIEKLKEKDLELGLVIDLTNTKRYYDPTEITSVGIEYEKIFTAGRVVPSISVQNNFFDAVDRFLASNKDNNRLIGVHCTHGLNRTGYLVCRYMIDCMKFEAKDAIDAFNQARGHDIERTEYVDDLIGAVGPPTLPNHDSYSPEDHIVSVDARYRDRDTYRQRSPRQYHPYQDTYFNSPLRPFSSGFGTGYTGYGNAYSRHDAYSRSRTGPHTGGNCYPHRGISHSRREVSQGAQSQSRAGRYGNEIDESRFHDRRY